MQATDRVELRNSAVMMGDIVTQRVAIEDGAYLKGKVDINNDAKKFEVKPEAQWQAPAAAQSVTTAAAGSGSTSSSGQTVKAEQKK